MSNRNKSISTIHKAAWIIFFAMEFILLKYIAGAFLFVVAAMMGIQMELSIEISDIYTSVKKEPEIEDNSWIFKYYCMMTVGAMAVIVGCDVVGNFLFAVTSEFDLMHDEFFRLCLLVTCWGVSIPLGCIDRHRIWIPYSFAVLVLVFMMNRVHHDLHYNGAIDGYVDCILIACAIALLSVVYGYGVLYILIKRLQVPPSDEKKDMTDIQNPMEK